MKLNMVLVRNGRFLNKYDITRCEYRCYLFRGELQRKRSQSKFSGYCDDEIMRKISILAAFDITTVRVVPGHDLFFDFTIDEDVFKAKQRKVRGINLAEGVRKPIIKNIALSCCCMQFVMYMMMCRNSETAVFTSKKVTVLWDRMHDKKALST
jgi:hypothetical protein